jgi:hypothetical protein
LDVHESSALQGGPGVRLVGAWPTDTEEYPERIDAEQNRASLMVTEHVGRYLWSARLLGYRPVPDGRYVDESLVW